MVHYVTCFDVNYSYAIIFGQYHVHTCDKFEMGIREIFLSFHAGRFLKNLYSIGKFLVHFREILNFT